MAYKVDTGNLDSAAGKVKGIASNFDSELKELKALVDGTASEWEGPTKDAFLATYEKYEKNMREFIASLDVYSNAMSAYAKDMDDTTATGTARFNAI